MDFIINERINGDKSSAQLFLESKHTKNDIEKEILNAQISSYTSLFEVHSINRNTKVVTLKDLLKKRASIGITDIGLSESLDRNILIFTRIIHFDDFNMSSGLAFLFPYDKTDILRSFRTLKNDNKDITRFIAFFTLFKGKGLNVIYQEVE